MVWASGEIDNLEDVGDALVGVFDNPALLIGIPLALLGAVFMSFGAQYQHRGVTKVERLYGGASSGGLTLTQLSRLLTRPSWVLGSVMLGSGDPCQLGALSFAPLIVVQPLGAIALVITTLLNARISGHKPTKRSVRAIVECVGGIFIFVTIAALVATDEPVSNGQLITILIILAVVTVVFGGAVAVAATADDGAVLHHRRGRHVRLRGDARESRHQPHPVGRLRVADGDVPRRAAARCRRGRVLRPDGVLVRTRPTS